MVGSIDERAKEILKKWHPNPKEAVWFHKQSNSWIARHKDLEFIAVKAGIWFDMPQVLEANGPEKCAALCIQGHLPDGDDEQTEWSIGEASPGNNKMGYPYAMAEKRGKDRVILKLLGLHGFVYSDVEAEAFKEPSPTQPPGNGAPPVGNVKRTPMQQETR